MLFFCFQQFWLEHAPWVQFWSDYLEST
jgi:hypothetical protein